VRIGQSAFGSCPVVSCAVELCCVQFGNSQRKGESENSSRGAIERSGGESKERGVEAEV